MLRSDLDIEMQNSRRKSPRIASQVGTGTDPRDPDLQLRESRITDHRINFTTHQLATVLDGDLKELIDEVTSHYQAEALKNANTDSGPAGAPA